MCIDVDYCKNSSTTGKLRLELLGIPVRNGNLSGHVQVEICLQPQLRSSVFLNRLGKTFQEFGSIGSASILHPGLILTGKMSSLVTCVQLSFRVFKRC